MSEETQDAKRPDFSLFGEKHIRAYRETNGEIGYDWNGTKILLLTTTGRKSGERRTSPLIFVPHGDGWAIIASKGGAPEHPAWYLNLDADPKVEVQVKGDVYEARARTAQGAEREQLWAEALKVWPSYDDYQAKTPRQIPVVVLEPVRKLANAEG